MVESLTPNWRFRRLVTGAAERVALTPERRIEASERQMQATVELVNRMVRMSASHPGEARRSGKVFLGRVEEEGRGLLTSTSTSRVVVDEVARLLRGKSSEFPVARFQSREVWHPGTPSTEAS